MFAEVKVDRWEDARRISLLLPNFAFRGQSDSQWELVPSLERASSAPGCLTHEEFMLEAFQRRAHHYLSHLPERDEKLEWLALMRHHGAPTRLLDFTSSFYVAAFFATEETDGDSAIWAVRMNPMQERDPNRNEWRPGRPLKVGSWHRHRARIALEAEGTPPPAVFDVQPFMIPERMSIQQGLFLMPTSLWVPFRKALFTTMELQPDKPAESISVSDIDMRAQHEIDVLRIVLPSATRAGTLRDLARMNITAASLFPGLDGFARSLKTIVVSESFPQYLRERGWGQEGLEVDG